MDDSEGDADRLEAGDGVRLLRGESHPCKGGSGCSESEELSSKIAAGTKKSLFVLRVP